MGWMNPLELLTPLHKCSSEFIMLEKYVLPLLKRLKIKIFKQRSDEEITSLGTGISSSATIFGTVLFFWDYAHDHPEGFPWLGIALVTASLASFILEGMVRLEKVNHGDKTGTWVAFLTAASLLAGLLGAALLIMAAF
ncbi:hypothetical protein PVT71_18185 [Salipiger sp. H15]|uniref:Uncharacterized protein n=1 Tax=Alloyangia sp. H15 TaxID=3029062 RepID=A0AAU8AQD5_9RHOB